MSSVGMMVVGLVLAAFALPAAAHADVQWRISSVNGPQNLVPGATAQYVVHAQNVGDADTSTSYTITDTLPADLTATAASGEGWDCSGTAFPTGTVTCSNANTVFAPGATVERRGFATPLFITASVAAGAGGTADNTVSISGGSATAQPATATDSALYSATPAGFGFAPGSFLSDVFTSPFPAVEVERQAGSHPSELRVAFRTNLQLSHDSSTGGTPYTEPQEHVRTLQTRLPVGFVGNPQAVPQCDPLLFNRPVPGNFGGCPPNTQVGSIDLILQDGTSHLFLNSVTDMPVFNLVPAPGVVAQFGLTFVGNPALISVTLDPTDRYSVIATLKDTTELLWVRSASLAMWGVPADHSHDALRVDPDAGSYDHPFSGAPIRPFLTLPSQCTTGGAPEARADSWQHPDAFTPWAAGTSAQMSGCDDARFRFNPSITLRPEALTPSTPTGLDVDVSVPQKDDAVPNANLLSSSSPADTAIATPPLRAVSVKLPEGMTVSPSSADGLAACTPAQIGLESSGSPQCPDASKIGTVEMETPLLADPVEGAVYLATQTDNPFGSLIALYIVLDDPSRGLSIKLPGKVEPDPTTGQLTATFSDNPQLPFSNLYVHFKGGPRAALVTPSVCRAKTTGATLTSWNEDLAPVTTTDSFTISGDGNGGPCPAPQFNPTLHAGLKNPTAGSSSTFVLRVQRDDIDNEFKTISTTMPPGLLAKVAGVPLCGDARAAAGACPADSQIGRVEVGAGAGSNPFYITNGKVYLTEGYKGGPFGLAISVPAVAGPFDLGTVNVRAALQIDPLTAQVTVVSDPMPRILEGIPLQVRDVRVIVDRDGFMQAPTNCDEMSIGATIGSYSDDSASVSNRFQVGECGTLAFAPKISMGFTNRSQMHKRKKPGLDFKLSQKPGEANIKSVTVKLPRSVVLDVNGASGALCEVAQAENGTCPASSIVGHASAVTPLLDQPLTGAVYFVRGDNALPNIMVALRGAININLRSKSKVDKMGRLISTFNAVPDAPIRQFHLTLGSAGRGVLSVAPDSDLCTGHNSKGKVSIAIVGQNGKRKALALKIKTPCKKARRHRR